jgi:hypothetical protein
MTNEITVFKEFESNLATLEESNAGMEFPDTPDGIDERRKWYKTLRKGTNALDKIRKEAGAEYLRLGREVNAEAKSIQVRLDAMELPHKTELDRIEAEVQAEIDEKAKIAEAAAALIEDERLAYIDNQEWENNKKAAELADQELALKEKADAAQKAIDDAAQAVKDEAAAKLLEEQIAHKAKNDLIAEQLVTKNAEQAKIDEADAKERLRVADVKHRKSIEDAIYKALLPFVDSKTEACCVLEAIKSGLIPHTEIKY